MEIAAIIVGIVSLFAGVIQHWSDQDQQLFAQVDAENFNSEEAQKARDWAVKGKYSDMLSLGFNPDLAAASVMGSNPAPSFAASNQASQMPALGGALSSLFGGLSDKFYQSALQDAQVKHLQSQTQFNDLQSFWLPLDMKSKIEVNDALVTKYVADGKLSNEQASWYKEQTRFIEPKATADIAKDYATFSNAMAEAALFWKQTEVQEVLKGLYGAETSYTWQQIRESKMKEFMYSAQGTLAYGQNEVALQQKENLASENVWLQARNAFVEKMAGFPFSADFKDMLFFMAATENGQADADGFIKAYGDGEAALYDKQVQNQLDNWWNNMLIGLGNVPEKFGEGVGFGVGYGIGGKGLNSNVKSSPNPSKGSNAAPADFGMKYIGTVKAPNGKTYKQWRKADGRIYSEPID